MYAIVDIETTGSHAHSNGITEIAIVLHNGKEVEGKFETLINPGYKIPRFVAALTGIQDHMVADAPPFSQVADKIYNLLKGRIFIAHNVNFDYSFIRHHFQQAGYDYNARKLCTVRLSRTAFPGFRKYGLDALCEQLNIMNGGRHRAGGDAEATATLFSMILNAGGEKLVKEYLKKESREQILPPNLPKEHVQRLPYQPGVYYFHDEKGKVIYVGKAKNIKQRVVSHFTGFDTGNRRQQFLKHIHAITYKEMPTELTAYLMESIEIKRLWPQFNQSQKKFEWQFGIYEYTDMRGYARLVIEKKRKHLHPLVCFSLKAEGYRIMWNLVKAFDLDAGLCCLDTTAPPPAEEPAFYNERVKKAVDWLHAQKETYLIKEEYRDATSCILVDRGRFYGMGVVYSNTDELSMEELKDLLNPYPENELIRTMISSFVDKHPKKVHKLAV